MSRFYLVAVLLLAGASLPAAENPVLTLVSKNCTGCHNTRNKSGDIDLRTPAADPGTFERDREIWEKVLEKLQTKQMPPPPLPQPPAAQLSAATAFLRGEFARQDKLIQPLPGHVTARRLNRAEYNNTMRDLLGIDIRPADAFPADTAAFGFDNVSDALNLTPALLENYLAAAERSVRSALFGPDRRKPAAIHYSAPVRINLSRGQKGLPADLTNYDETGLSTPHSFHVMHRFEVDGEYEFRLTLNGHRPNQSMPARPALYIDSKLVHEFEVDATDFEGQIVEARVPVSAGDRLISVTYHRNYHGLPPSYGGPEPSTRPPVPLLTSTRGKLNEQDIETLRRYGTRIKPDAVETRIDNRFEAVDVIGPYNQRTGALPEARRRIFTCGHLRENLHGASCPRTILRTFASRAFRRPATAGETERYLDFYKLARSHGESFDEAIGTALQAILVAPEFLFRMEGKPAGSQPFLSHPTSLLRACRTFSGAPRRTPNCSAPRHQANSPARPRSKHRYAACSGTRTRRRWWRTSSGSGCSSATSTW